MKTQTPNSVVGTRVAGNVLTCKLLVVVMMCTLLAACGQSKSDRAISGGGIGAGAGAVGSAILGGNPVTGAVVGGAVGAATGGLTDQNDIDLGKPVWRR